MANIDNLPFTIEELREAYENGDITARRSGPGDLWIYNYSAMVQYNRNWNNVTKNCRGLILDNKFNIVSRPFGKIFNYTEIVPDPVIFDRVPNVSDKADGSLGILYNAGGSWNVATRGSFESDQAYWASEWLWQNMPGYSQPENVTTLVEIIYPENRICVDYGGRAELVLIAVIDNETGADIPLQTVDWWHGARVEEYTGFDTIDDAYRFATSNDYENREGVVCTWFKYNEPSFRLKIKHPEYVRLHGIIHSFSVKKVWESLSSGEDFLSLLADVPDEFYSLVKDTVKTLEQEYSIIESAAKLDYDKIKHITNRKEFAVEAKQSLYSPMLFAMADNKPYEQMIWKLIKPRSE